MDPGPVEAGFRAATGHPGEAIRRLGSEILSAVPPGRFGRAEEIAAVAAFPMSREASFVTGLKHVADGGMSEL